MMYEWHIKVHDSQASFDKEIWFIRRGPDGTYVWYPEGEKKVDYGQDVKPSIRLDVSLFKLLVDALGPEFKSPEKPYLEGKVEAMSEHLHDLRWLLKLKKIG